jgi:hypothetical protein
MSPALSRKVAAAAVLLAAGLAAPMLLAATGGAAATKTTATTTTTSTTSPAPPAIETSNFVCSNGVCAIGPGDVHMPFAAGLIGTGGPDYTGPECNPYFMTVIIGALPPGLQLAEPICEWEISGTSTKAGIYSFTVQIAPQPNNLGQQAGPDGTQQFTITIGSGNADRLVVTAATWFSERHVLQVAGFDVNYGASYIVSVTSTGAKVGTLIRNSPDNGGDDNFRTNFQETTDLDNITVNDSLGGSVSIPVAISTKY